VYVVYRTVAWVIARKRKQAMRLFNRHYFVQKYKRSRDYVAVLENLIKQGKLVHDEAGYYKLPHHTNQRLGMMGSSHAPDENCKELRRFLAEQGLGEVVYKWWDSGSIYMAWVKRIEI
jgi:hypothetical protein